VALMSAEPERVVVGRSDEGPLVVTGELDAYTSPMLDKALDELDDGDAVVSLDLSGVTFIDSSALHVLVAHEQRVTGSGGSFRLRQPSTVVVRLLDVAGLAGHFEIDT
jgi:anti-anti-sigma factor